MEHWMRKSCTVSMEVQPGLCSETSTTLPNNAHGRVSIRSKITDVNTIEEQFPVPISFPPIKVELEENTPNGRQPIADVDCPGSQFVRSETHKKQNTGHGGRQMYICYVCGKSFMQKCHLSQHKLTHSEERPSVCNKSLEHGNTLNLHQHTGSGESSVTSKMFGRLFERQKLMNLLVHTGSGESSVSRNMSRKSFQRQKSMNPLQHTGSGERPVTCNVFNKSLKRWNSLNLYQNMGSGEHTFRCGMCFESFRQIRDLDDHEYKDVCRPMCYICGQAFNNRRSFLVHKRAHMEEHLAVSNKSFEPQSIVNLHQHTCCGEHPCTCNVCNISGKLQSSLNFREHTQW